MPERPRQRPPQRTLQQSYNQSPGNYQTRRVRHVTEQSQDVIQATTEDESESIDPEATLYLKELTEDWANIDLVKPKSWTEIWFQTTCNNSEKIEWLADTGLPEASLTNPRQRNLCQTTRTSK